MPGPRDDSSQSATPSIRRVLARTKKESRPEADRRKHRGRGSRGRSLPPPQPTGGLPVAASAHPPAPLSSPGPRPPNSEPQAGWKPSPSIPGYAPKDGPVPIGGWGMGFAVRIGGVPQASPMAYRVRTSRGCTGSHRRLRAQSRGVRGANIAPTGCSDKEEEVESRRSAPPISIVPSSARLHNVTTIFRRTCFSHGKAVMLSA